MQSLLIAAVLGNAFVVTEWESQPAPVEVEFVVTEWNVPAQQRPRTDTAGALAVLGTMFTPGTGVPAKPSAPLAVAEAAHTPMSEVVRVLDLLPRPQVGFVDLGCGYDARWCIAAAEKWGCRVTGVEIDPQRAAAARERVRNLGLDHLITIVEGDVGTVPIAADVAVCYLYPELLERLRPRLEGFTAFASYLHQPAGLPVTKNGDSWLYRNPTPLVWADHLLTQSAKQAQQVVYQPPQTGARQALWQGVAYTRPVCTSAGCQMCNSIRYQLSRR